MTARAKNTDHPRKIGKIGSHDVRQLESDPPLWKLAEEQGVKPLARIEDLAGDFWPSDEGPDDFINALREWRREDRTRDLE